MVCTTSQVFEFRVLEKAYGSSDKLPLWKRMVEEKSGLYFNDISDLNYELHARVFGRTSGQDLHPTTELPFMVMATLPNSRVLRVSVSPSASSVALAVGTGHSGKEYTSGM